MGEESMTAVMTGQPPLHILQAQWCQPPLHNPQVQQHQSSEGLHHLILIPPPGVPSCDVNAVDPSKALRLATSQR